jgi:protein-S-isoprenylcysteine O-methyltransferase Ste14
MFLAVPLHYRSVEYIKLQDKYGWERGRRIGKIYGTISGTMELVFLIGLWVSPQPRFSIPLYIDLVFSKYRIPFIHLFISLPLILYGAWIAIESVLATGLIESETHSLPEKLQTRGFYSLVRHPQYFGWILVDVGASILFSALYSILFSPVMVLLIYLMAWKEEEELIKVFGDEYKV